MKLTEFSIWGSDIDLDENFRIKLTYNRIPLEKALQRIEFLMVCILKKGQAVVDVNGEKYDLSQGMILSVFPLQVVEVIYESKDLEIMFFTCKPPIIEKLLFRFPPEYEFFLREFPTYKLPDKVFIDDLRTMTILNEKMDDRENICRSEIVLSILRYFFLEMYNKLHKRLLINSTQQMRKKEILIRFYQLVSKHHKESREVSFYADKLNITPKYLSLVTTEVRGVTAKRIIDNFIIMEIKLLLRTKEISIQEITDNFNFPDQAFLSKYFKKQTGFSPSQFRGINMLNKEQ